MNVDVSNMDAQGVMRAVHRKTICEEELFRNESRYNGFPQSYNVRKKKAVILHHLRVSIVHSIYLIRQFLVTFRQVGNRIGVKVNALSEIL